MLPFTGLTVVVTGQFDEYGLTRDQAEAAVGALGGKLVGSISGKTGLVVPGKGAGLSKMEKVDRFDVPVLEPQAYAALVADPSSWDGQPLGVRPSERADAKVPTNEPAEPYVAPAHPVTTAIIYPTSGREIRLSCGCGHKWLGENIQNNRCPKDAL